MTAPEQRTLLIVFARAPQPGAVKTRLIPLLGAEGAAALHARLVGQALAAACASSLGPVELHGTPDADDPFFRSCAARSGVTTRPQADGDLGARMHAAFRLALARHERVLLMGSDCPALTIHHLREADRHLREGADAVFAPCEDGGYALLGLRRLDAALFDGITWGSDSVMARSRAQLGKLGWQWRETETLWDVDRPGDYARLAASGLLDAGCAHA